MAVAVRAANGGSSYKGGSGDEGDSRRVRETARGHHGLDYARRLDGGRLFDVGLSERVRLSGARGKLSPPPADEKIVAIRRLLPATLKESNRPIPETGVPGGGRNEWRRVYRPQARHSTVRRAGAAFSPSGRCSASSAR